MEQLANFTATSTLNMPGDVDSVSTTLTLVSTSSFPSSYPFRIRIDDELMKVTASPGTNQFTVTRGDGGTTAVGHANGGSVVAVLTKESLDSIISIQNSGTEVTNRRVLNFIGANSIADDSSNNRVNISIPSVTDAPYTTTLVSDWTVLGTGTLTTQGKGALYFTAPNNGSNAEQLTVACKTVPATPWAATFRARLFVASTNAIAGFCFLQSVDNKSSALALHVNLLTGFQAYKYNNLTTYSGSSYFNNKASASPNDGWYRLSDNGTSRIFSYSVDGYNWHVLFSVGRTDFLTADRVGIFLDPFSSDSLCGILLSSFSF